MLPAAKKLARIFAFLSLLADASIAPAAGPRPNILLAISDDQSYPHASAYGNPSTQTPAFDRVAREGVLFNNAFVAYPSCSPSRAALLTGRYPWQIEHAGNFSSTFPPKYPVYPDILENAGYWVGYTGKGWAPGDWRGTGRLRNPAGTEYNQRQAPSPPGINGNDYARNFEEFLDRRPDGKPFAFWFGSTEPHRRYDDGIGLRNGKNLDDAAVPGFLPDLPIVRGDILDYSVEIEWFDKHLGRMLELLERRGELDNTLIVVTSDNGMPFPRAKSNVYEFGLHVPLAIMFSARIPAGRVVDDMISLIDLTPTFLEAAGVDHPGPYPMAGHSLIEILESEKQGLVDASRKAIVAGRERHGSARYKNFGYPQRMIRTHEYLYLRNYEPDFWPAGQPRDYDYDGTLRPMHSAYRDIDDSPSKSLLVNRRDDEEIAPYFHLSMAKRPAEELYAIADDPGCVDNLAADSRYAEIKSDLVSQLDATVTQTGDARAVGNGAIFRTYKRMVRGFRYPDPNDPNPPAIQAITPPVRERHGGELPSDSKAGVSVVIEVLAGQTDFPSRPVSLEIPEPLLGHAGFTLVRLHDNRPIDLQIHTRENGTKRLYWTLGETLRAGQSRRFRLTPSDDPNPRAPQIDPAKVDSKTTAPPWVYIVHGQ